MRPYHAWQSLKGFCLAWLVILTGAALLGGLFYLL